MERGGVAEEPIYLNQMAHKPPPPPPSSPPTSKILRWSEPISGGRDEENQQQQLVTNTNSTNVPQPKIDQRWAKSKQRSFSFSAWVPRRTDEKPPRVRLYEAAQQGDWETAMEMAKEYGAEALTTVLNDRSETALHVATKANRVDFVRRLVGFLDPHDLALKNNYGNTAFCIAAASGALDIAKLMIAKYEALCLIRGPGNATPVLIAATYRQQHMVSFLLSKTPVFGLPISDQIDLLLGAISADYFDIAFLILEWNKLLALERDLNDDTPLHVMARRSTVGQSNTNYPWWKHVYREKKMRQRQAREMVEQLWEVVLDEIPKNEILKFIMYPTSMLHDAAEVGNVEFLRIVIKSNPDLAWKFESPQRSIFHVAVENRQYKVWSLIYETGSFLDYLPNYVDVGDTSLLELAARMPDPCHLSRISGAAFQMHRELIWFEEVEKIVELTMRRKKGMNRSPRELFTLEHYRLVNEGERWMKETAHSCMLVATLITTVVFAAVFTVPGGYNNNNNNNNNNAVNDNTGTPLFLYQTWFTVFVISDAVALISSSTSILLFLSIQTSRCEEEDFLIWLPLKLLFGLGTLFFSVVTMILAFIATFFMFYGKNTAWVPLLVAGMAIVPVYCFGFLQFSLWVDTVEALGATHRLYFGNRNRKAI